VIREGDNGGNSASYVTESSMEYIRAMPRVSLSSNFCLPGTVVPNRFERRETSGATTRHETAASRHSEMTRGLTRWTLAGC